MCCAGAGRSAGCQGWRRGGCGAATGKTPGAAAAPSTVGRAGRSPTRRTSGPRGLLAPAVTASAAATIPSGISSLARRPGRWAGAAPSPRARGCRGFTAAGPQARPASWCFHGRPVSACGAPSAVRLSHARRAGRARCAPPRRVPQESGGRRRRVPGGTAGGGVQQSAAAQTHPRAHLGAAPRRPRQPPRRRSRAQGKSRQQ